MELLCSNTVTDLVDDQTSVNTRTQMCSVARTLEDKLTLDDSEANSIHELNLQVEERRASLPESSHISTTLHSHTEHPSAHPSVTHNEMSRF